LIECFDQGETARFDLDDDGEPVSEARGEVVRWLFANGGTGEGARVGGLHVVNLRVPDEELDLDGVSVGFPVLLEGCRLGRVLLRDARLVTLKLSGTHCNGILGDRLRAAHGLLLNEGFTAYEGTRLRAIRVGDDLNCIGGRFAAAVEGRSALQLDGAHIDGRLYLSNSEALPAIPGLGEETGEEAEPARAGGVSAQGARVGGNLLCIESTFVASTKKKSALHLEGCVVDGDAVFVRMTAQGKVKMRQARFSGTLTLRGVTITDVFDLRRSSIGGEVNFGSSKKTPATLGPELLLDGATIGGRLNMGSADLSATGSIDLSRARIGYLDDRHVNWPEDALVLEGIQLGGIAMRSDDDAIQRRLTWLVPAEDDDWSPQPYGQVISAMRLAGEEDRARKVAIERERDRRSKGGLSKTSKAWNWLLDVTIRYGYRPYRAFGGAAIVILVCWVVYSGGFGVFDLFDPVLYEQTKKNPELYRLVYSLDAFLPIVDLGQASEHTPKGLLGHITLWTEICLGWLLTTLGVVGVTGLIRNE
jgi:hypothetical protein